MPQGRGSSKRTSKAKAPEKAESAQEAVDGVVVRVVPGEGGEGGEGGGTTRQIQTFGSVSVNELPTLLRLAAKDVERSLGLE